jgi:hypothetical protein
MIECAKCKNVETMMVINDHISLCKECFDLEVNFGVDNLEKHDLNSMGFTNGTSVRNET